MCLLCMVMMPGCNLGKKDAILKNFANEFDLIQKTFTNDISVAKTEEERNYLIENKNKQLDSLLRKFDNEISSDEGELIKCKLLMEISRYKDASKKLDDLINRKSTVMVEAGMVKVQLLLHSGEIDKAISLLSEIEKGVKKGSELYNVWLYLALHSPDKNTMKEYGEKLLEIQDISIEYKKFLSEVLRNLSEIARENKDTATAKSYLEKALSKTEEAGLKSILELELTEMNLLGTPSLPLYADTWFNTDYPPALDRLKGNAIVLIFWADWSLPSKDMMETITGILNELKGKNLSIIGFTKLYGKTANSKENDPPLNKTEETTIIKNSIEKMGVTFPIGIANDGFIFDDYKIGVLPALIFIDKNGIITDFKNGTSSMNSLRSKILKLME